MFLPQINLQACAKAVDKVYNINLNKLRENVYAIGSIYKGLIRSPIK